MAGKVQRGKSRSERQGGRSEVSEVRLIAGRFRGRKLQFEAAEGLRPTLDRIRETVFNWLGSYYGLGGEEGLSGLHCVDLFAGTGALGAEALSRGAAFVVFADTNTRVCRQISASLEHLSGSEPLSKVNFEVRCGAALSVMTALEAQDANRRFDLVFLDPPFGKGLLQPCLETLCGSQLLKSTALIYFEAEKVVNVAAMLPTGWDLYRHKLAGQLQYGLIRCQNSPK
ncbi:16S rRNA (guanine(966)-N(2))-methyltransferase RsmD [Allohahella marinimesophila]|uniref:Ribosomal RNA small subunit methyltransferase D n=1 Tax=Allohahella marinimesophila TaxID=1054972 RepID=A0ABP7PIU0_9GAMM